MQDEYYRLLDITKNASETEESSEGTIEGDNNKEDIKKEEEK